MGHGVLQGGCQSLKHARYEHLGYIEPYWDGVVWELAHVCACIREFKAQGAILC